VAKKSSRSGIVVVVIITAILVGIGVWTMFGAGVFDGVFSSAKNGTVAIGEIVSAERTGDRVNDSPEVKFVITFYTQDGEQITATCEDTIPIEQLANIHPGMLISIRYDPAKPQVILLAPDIDDATGDKAMDQYLLAAGFVTQAELDIKYSGVQAKAVVVTATPTGEIMSHDRTQMTLEIKVTRPGGGTYDVKTTVGVSREDLSYVAVGSILKVFYLPDNEQKVYIDFNR